MTKFYKNRLSEEQVNSQAKQVVSQQPVQTQATQVSQQAPVQQATPTQQVQQSAPQNSQTANGQTQPNQTRSQSAENIQTQTARSQQTTTPQTATNSQNMEQPFVSAQPTTKKAVVPQNQKWLSIITDPAMQGTICNYQGVISSATVNNGQLLIESYYKEKDILESLNIRLPKFMRKRLTEAVGIPTGAVYMQVDPNVQKRLGNDFNVTKVEGTNQGLIYTDKLGRTKIQKFLKDGQTLSKNFNWLNEKPTQQVQQAPTATADGQATNSQNLQVNSTTQANNNSNGTKTGKPSTDEGAEPTQEQKQELSNIAKGNLTEFANAFVSVFTSQIEEINNYLKKFNNPCHQGGGQAWELGGDGFLMKSP